MFFELIGENLVFRSIIDYIMQINVLIGLSVVVIGIIVAVLSRRIARMVRKTNDVKDDDRIMLALRMVGLSFILIGFVVSIL